MNGFSQLSERRLQMVNQKTLHILRVLLISLVVCFGCSGEGTLELDIVPNDGTAEITQVQVRIDTENQGTFDINGNMPSFNLREGGYILGVDFLNKEGKPVAFYKPKIVVIEADEVTRVPIELLLPPPPPPDGGGTLELDIDRPQGSPITQARVKVDAAVVGMFDLTAPIRMNLNEGQYRVSVDFLDGAGNLDYTEPPKAVSIQAGQTKRISIVLPCDFEPDTVGFELFSEWPAGKRLTHSNEKVFRGECALKLEAFFTGKGWQEAGGIKQLGGEDWSAFEQISVYIYVPRTATGFIVQLHLQTKVPNLIWEHTSDISLKPDQWNQVVVVLGDLVKEGELKDVRAFGIKIGTSTTAFEGAFFIDNVSVE
jgi:hypothetical protein